MAEYDNSYMLKARLKEIQTNAERIRSSQSSEGFTTNSNKQYQKQMKANAEQVRLQAEYYNNQQQQQLKQAEQLAEEAKHYSNYNDGTQVNSLADILMDKSSKDNKVASWVADKVSDLLGWNTTQENSLYAHLDNVAKLTNLSWVTKRLLSDTSIDYFKNRSAISNLFKAADTAITGGDFAKAKEYGYIAVNNGLVALGEDLDILANPVKSITTNFKQGHLEDIPEDYLSVYGLSEKYGYGNRKNYDYDTGAEIKVGDVNLLEIPSFIPIVGGTNLADLLLETISDPVNILEMGAGTIAKRGVNNLFKNLDAKGTLKNFLQHSASETTLVQVKTAQREIIQNLLDGKATSLKGAVNNVIKDYTTSNVVHAELNIKPKYDGGVLDYLHILSAEIDDTLVNNVLQGAIGITQAANKLDSVIVHMGTAELGLVHPVEWAFKKYKSSNLHLGLRVVNKINTNLNEVLSTKTWSAERKEAANKINLDWLTPDQLNNINELFKTDANIAADKELMDSYTIDIVTDTATKLNEALNEINEKVNNSIRYFNKELISHSDDAHIRAFMKTLDIKTSGELKRAYKQLFDIVYNLDPELADNAGITQLIEKLNQNIVTFMNNMQYKNILNDINRIGDIRQAIENNILSKQDIKSRDVLDKEFENKINSKIDKVAEDILDINTQDKFTQAHAAIFNHIYERIPNINDKDNLAKWCEDNTDDLDKLKQLMLIMYKDGDEYVDGNELYITDTIAAIDDLRHINSTSTKIDPVALEDVLNDLYWNLEDVKDYVIDTYADVFERTKSLEQIDDIIFKDLETKVKSSDPAPQWSGQAISDLNETIKKAHNFIISGKTEYIINESKKELYQTEHKEDYDRMIELINQYTKYSEQNTIPIKVNRTIANVSDKFYDSKEAQIRRILNNYFIDEEKDITKLPNLSVRRLTGEGEGEGFDVIWDLIEPTEDTTQLINLVKKYRSAVTDRKNQLEELIADKSINSIRVYNVVASVEARESAIIEAIGLNTPDGEQKIINLIAEMKRFADDARQIQLDFNVGNDIDTDILCVQKSFEHWILFNDLRNKVTKLVNTEYISKYKHKYGKQSNSNERVAKFIIDQLSNYWGETWRLNNILDGKYLTECADSIIERLDKYTDVIIEQPDSFKEALYKIIEEYVGALYKYQAGARFAPNGKDLLDNLKQFKKDANSLYRIGYKFDPETRRRITLTRTDIGMSEQLTDGLQEYICNLVDTFTAFNNYNKEHWSDYVVDYLDFAGNPVMLTNKGHLLDIIDIAAELQIDLDNVSGYSIIKALTNGTMGLKRMPVENIFIKGLHADNSIIPDTLVDFIKKHSGTVNSTIDNIRFISNAIKQINELPDVYGVDSATYEFLKRDDPIYFERFLPLVKRIILKSDTPDKWKLLEAASILAWSKELTDVGSYKFAKYLFNKAVYNIYSEASEGITKQDIKIKLCKDFANPNTNKLLTMLIDNTYITETKLYTDNNYIVRKLYGLEESKHSSTEGILNGIANDTDAALDLQITKTLGAESRNMFYTIHGRLLTEYKDNPKVARDLSQNRNLLRIFKCVQEENNVEEIKIIRDMVSRIANEDSVNNTNVLTNIISTDIDMFQSMLYKSTPGFIVLSPHDNKQALELQELFTNEFINKLNRKHIGIRIEENVYTFYLTKKLDHTKLKELKNYNVLSSIKGLDLISNTKFGVKGNITNTRFNDNEALLNFMKDLPKDFAYTVDDFSLRAPAAFDKGDMFTFNNLSFDNTFFGNRQMVNDILQRNTDWDYTKADNLYATFVDNISANTAAQLLFNYDLRPKFLDVLRYAPSITDETIRNFFKEHKEYVALYYEIVNNEAKPKIIKLGGSDLVKTITELNPILITRVEADNIIKSSRHSLSKRSLGFECLSTYSSVLKASYLSTIGLVYRNFTSSISKAILDAAHSTSDYLSLAKEALDVMKVSMQKMNKYQECYLAISRWVVDNGYASTGSDGTHITKALMRKFFKDPANAEWVGFMEDYKYIDDWVNAGYTSTLTKILEDQEKNEVLKGVNLLSSLKNTGERVDKAFPNASPLERKVHAFNQIATDIAWKNPWTKFITSMNNGVEAYARYFTFEWNVRHGSDVAQAAEHVRAAHFDYDPKSDLADVMNTIIPFINFRVANTLYWLDELYSNPMLTKLIADSLKDNGIYSYDTEELIDQDNFIERLFSGLVPTSIEGLYFKLNGDYLDALRFAANPLDSIVDSLLGLKTLVTYKEYEGTNAELQAEYDQWKKQLELYRQFEYMLEPEYRRSEEKIEAERRYFEERLQYNDYCKKDLLINLIPFVDNARKVGLFDMLDDLDADLLGLSRNKGSVYDISRATDGAQLAFAELYKGISQGDQEVIANALAKGMGSLFTTHNQRYYFSYGNLNASTSDYDKYLEHLSKGAKEGWAGITQDIAIPKQYYALVFADTGKAYLTTKEDVATNLIASGATPLNDEAKVLSIGVEVNKRTSNFKQHSYHYPNRAILNMAKTQAFYSTRPSKAKAVKPTTGRYYSRFNNTTTQTRTKTYTQTRTQTKTSTDNLLHYGYYRPARARSISTSTGKNKRSRG